MEKVVSSLPEYDNPPLVEVVFGIQFKELKGLATPYIGLFWDKIGRDKFPKYEEMALLPHVVEKYGVLGAEQNEPSILMSKFPLWPRIFFTSKDGNGLIQIQRDRFLRNWRKSESTSGYPRYASLFPKFLDSWNTFSNFLHEFEVGQLEPDQYELTYMDHIQKGKGWETLGEIGKVFRNFRYGVSADFLPTPDDIAWQMVYPMRNNTGRLHVSVRHGLDRNTKNPLLVLNVTARGYSEDMKGWFDTAHEWIVRGFADLTESEVQKSVWKLKE